MLTENQATSIKGQLIDQIKKGFPQNQQKIAIQQIELMNVKELEIFLEQNNLTKYISPKEKKEIPEEKISCIFCAISQNKIPSYLLTENKKAIAVLEINPISKGHSIIIPKEHIEEASKIPQNAFSLAKKIAKKIKTKLKPKEITITSNTFMGHSKIDVIPVYTNENIFSKRKKVSELELKETKEVLEIKKRPRKNKKKPEIKSQKIILRKRIP